MTYRAWLSEPPPPPLSGMVVVGGGDTDKRFSFLCVMLMMSVCSDVSVCV